MRSGSPAPRPGSSTTAGRGLRPRYRDDYYGGFLRDPDGNSVEAVHHGDVRPGGIDHLWVRVADLDASRRFYEVAAPHAGIRLVDEHAAPRAVRR